MKSHRKPLIAALVTMIFCFSFISLIQHFKNQKESLEHYDVDAKLIPDFILTAADGSIFTKAHMKNKVTVLFYLSSKKHSYDLESRYMSHIETYIHNHLKDESQQKTLLLTFGDITESEKPFWHVIHPDASQKEELVKIDATLADDAAALFFDKFGILKGKILFSATDDESYLQSQIEKILSKLLFDQYLNDYLSKRTFFGPKRNHS